ncbi:MAG: type IV pilus assembly protein PilM [Fimbriimonadaceae bacterium]|nr:type IV pilus assembly protein PilM [Fimbriimonadaceae bacterium]
MSLSIFKRQNVVGLDLGHHTFQAVEMERSGDVWKVVKAGSVQTPPDSVRDGVIIDPESAAFAIKQLLRDTHIGASGVHIAVAGGTVVVRNVKMPAMTEQTLRKSIQFEASRYVPSSVEDSYIEFEILGKAEDNQMDVLIVAAPKDIVQSRVLACEKAGLRVESVDVEVFAAYRALIEAGDIEAWQDKTVALVDIGASTTNVSVIQRGTFAMTRTMPQGGQILTDALKSYFKLGDEEAEAGKASLDFKELLDDSTPKENPPLRVLQPHVDDLVREVRRSLNYYQSQQQEANQSKQIDALIITGGGAMLNGLSQYMGHKLGLATESLGVFVNPRFVLPEPTEDAGLAWSVVMGLAMRSHAKSAKAKAA